MSRVKSVIILILLFPAVVSGQSAKKYTLEIFEEGLASGLEKLFYLPDVNRNYQFVFVVNEPNIRGAIHNNFIKSVIRKTAEKDNIRYSFTDNPDSISKDSVFYIIYTSQVELETKYPRFIKNRFLGDKTIERNITGNIFADMRSSDNTFSHRENIALRYTDEIEYDSYKSYESPEYIFTTAKPPHTGAFESVLFPALLVTISAAATILFFTIRSK